MLLKITNIEEFVESQPIQLRPYIKASLENNEPIFIFKGESNE